MSCDAISYRHMHRTREWAVNETLCLVLLDDTVTADDWIIKVNKQLLGDDYSLDLVYGAYTIYNVHMC